LKIKKIARDPLRIYVSFYDEKRGWVLMKKELKIPKNLKLPKALVKNQDLES